MPGPNPQPRAPRLTTSRRAAVDPGVQAGLNVVIYLAVPVELSGSRHEVVSLGALGWGLGPGIQRVDLLLHVYQACKGSHPEKKMD